MTDVFAGKLLQDSRFSSIIQAQEKNANLLALNVLKLLEERQ